jgi:RimJ/RimL family protein N-acetyltransferase
VIAGKRVIDRRPVEVLPRPDMTTQRLVFRSLMPTDQEAFIDALQHSRSEVRRWIPVNHEGESDEHFFHRTMTRARLQDIEGGAWRRAVFIERGEHAGRFLGMFNLIKIQRGLEWSCEANWWVDSRLGGQGFGSEATQGMIDHALAEHPMGLGLHVVRAFICADNPASIRLAQKCGFKPTGNRDLLDINKALVHHDEYECWAR